MIAKSLKKLAESYLLKTNKKYEVIMGYDGKDLINYIIEDQTNGNMIKCVITDENMEYLDGSVAIKIIRLLERKGVIKPVIIFSSTCHEDEQTIKSILEAGSQLILPKPMQEIDLKRAFRDFNI